MMGKWKLWWYCRALDAKSLKKREMAPKVLGNLGDTRAVEPLIRALGDEEWRVRKEVAEALGKLGDARAVKPLIRVLEDKDENVRCRAAEALGKLGNDHSVDSLIRVLGDGDSDVRRAAAEALGALGETTWQKLVRGDYRDDFKRLGDSGDSRAVEPLIKALGCEDELIRRGAATALGTLGAVEPLIGALKNDDMRHAVATALGNLGDARAVEPLNQVLDDRDKYVRIAVASALGKLGDFRAVEPLIGVLADEDDDVRSVAAKVLGNLGDTRAVEPLIRALGDEEWRVRKEVAEALGKLGDARAVKPLIRVLEDKDENVRCRAAEALGKLGNDHPVESLIVSLQDEDKQVRQHAAASLDKIGWKPDRGENGAWYWSAKGKWQKAMDLGAVAVEPLIAALKDDDESVRNKATKALKQIGDAAIELIIPAIQGKDGQVTAAETLLDLHRKGCFSQRVKGKLLAIPGMRAMLQPTCALCGASATGRGAKTYGNYPDVKHFCSKSCWSARGRILGSADGVGCPYYSTNRMCRPPRGPSYPCSCPGRSYQVCRVYRYHEHGVLPY